MEGLLLLIVGYIVIGFGLIRLSMFLTKHIPFLAKRTPLLAQRVAIHTAVFTFWFMPGLSVGEGGAMPCPMWLVLLEPRQGSNVPMVVIIFGLFAVFWVITWVVTLGVTYICAWCGKNIKTKPPKGGNASTPEEW